MTTSGHLLRPEPGETSNPATTITVVPGDDRWTLTDLTDWISANIGQYAMAGTALVLAALLLARLASKRRSGAVQTERDEITSTDRAITRVTALIATAVLAEGMWSFFADVVHVAWPIRVILFSFIEMQILAATRRATRHLYRRGSLGTAPRTVLGLAAASATLAAVHANTLDERLFRLFAAGVAAYMWIEELREERDILHHKNPDKYAAAKRIKFNWAVTPERVLSRLGFIETSDRAMSDVDRARRIAKFGRVVARLHRLQTSGAMAWRIRRAERRRDRQVELMNEHLNMATDRSVMSEVQMHLATLYQAREGVTPMAVRGLSPWALPAATGQQSATMGDTRPDSVPDSRGDVAPDMGPHMTIDMLSGLAAGPRQDTTPGRSADTRPDIRATSVPEPTTGTVTAQRPDARPTRSRLRGRTSDRTSKWTPQQLKAFKMRDEDDATYGAIARKLSVTEKTIGRWFKERERVEDAQQALALSPDILSALPEPKPPVTSGTNGYHINVKEDAS